MRHHHGRGDRFEAAIGKGRVVRRVGVRIGERVVSSVEDTRTVSGEIDGTQADAILPAEAQLGHGAGVTWKLTLMGMCALGESWIGLTYVPSSWAVSVVTLPGRGAARLQPFHRMSFSLT